MQLTDNAASDRNPAWSPDGRKIAFVSNRTHRVHDEIYVMSASGTGVTRLTFGTANTNNAEPAWWAPH